MGWAAARAEPLRNASGRFWLSSDPLGIRRDRGGRSPESRRAAPVAPITEPVAPRRALALRPGGRWARPACASAERRATAASSAPKSSPGGLGAARDQAERGDQARRPDQRTESVEDRRAAAHQEGEHPGRERRRWRHLPAPSRRAGERPRHRARRSSTRSNGPADRRRGRAAGRGRASSSHAASQT